MIIIQANIEEKKYFYNYMKSVNRWITEWNNENDLMCAIEDNWELIWFAREVIFTKDKISVIWNVWIREDYRGKKLGLKLVQYLVDNIKQNIVRLDCVPSLEFYYNTLWFKKVSEIPEWYLSNEELKTLIAMKLIK